MVTYDREFLVPYLKNLCALYYAKRKLEVEYDRAVKKCTEYRYVEPHYEQPMYDEYDRSGHYKDFNSYYGGILPSIVFAIFLIIAGIKSSFPIGCVIGIIWIIGTFLFVRSDIADGKKDYEAACEQVKSLNKKIDIENSERANQFPQYYAHQCLVEDEMNQVQSLIDRAYDANIIPGNYREMYAVVYLYDYFSKSRSNDMDIALNTYVLEQIKAKLDIIIQNQSDILLNQELMLANQERAMEERRTQNKRLEQKLNLMNCELEEANQYRQVIHSDLETANFFARDSYLRRLCS